MTDKDRSDVQNVIGAPAPTLSVGVVTRLLAGLTDNRKKHSLAVGRKAASVAHLVPDGDRSDLAMAGTLHDVGYAHPSTGLHAIDGAAFLARQGFSPLVCHLVAHHTCAPMEAEVRGLPQTLFEPFSIDRDVKRLHKIICWADMTTGPAGANVIVEDRLDEVLQRYGPDDAVTHFITAARATIIDLANLGTLDAPPPLGSASPC